MLIIYLKRKESKNIQFDYQEEDWKVTLRGTCCEDRLWMELVQIIHFENVLVSLK
jgi:hypothetical protein